MSDLKVQESNPPDPTSNVQNIVAEAVKRLDDLMALESRRIDDKIDANNVKYQIQFGDSKEAVTAALTATKEAINKADQANEKRFDSVNEFRSTLLDQQTKLITRTEYDSAHKSLTEKIDGVVDRINRTEGASGVYVTHNDLDLAMEKLQTNIEATLRPVVTFMNTNQGRGDGMRNLWGIILGAVGFSSTLVLLILRLAGR